MSTHADDIHLRENRDRSGMPPIWRVQQHFQVLNLISDISQSIARGTTYMHPIHVSYSQTVLIRSFASHVDHPELPPLATALSR